MSLRLKFLGTGDAGGIPLFGCRCAVCVNMKKNGLRRSPCSAIIRFDTHAFLLDAGRMDLHIRWGNPELNIPVHGPADQQGCGDLLKHPGILDFSDPMLPFHGRELNGIHITPVPLNHSKPTLGYCFDYQGKRMAYLTDTLGLPAETETFLLAWQPDIMVLDCSHPPDYAHIRNHNDLISALSIHKKISPSQSWLTHISHELELYWHTQGVQLPANVRIAADGFEVTLANMSDTDVV